MVLLDQRDGSAVAQLLFKLSRIDDVGEDKREIRDAMLPLKGFDPIPRAFGVNQAHVRLSYAARLAAHNQKAAVQLPQTPDNGIGGFTKTNATRFYLRFSPKDVGQIRTAGSRKTARFYFSDIDTSALKARSMQT